jgi:hypothetical protein
MNSISHGGLIYLPKTERRLLDSAIPEWLNPSELQLIAQRQLKPWLFAAHSLERNVRDVIRSPDWISALLVHGGYRDET